MKKNVMMFICCLFLMAVALAPARVFGWVDSLNVSKVNSIFINGSLSESQLAIQGQMSFVIGCAWDFSDFHLQIMYPERERPIEYRNHFDEITGLAVSGDYAYLGANRGWGESFLAILNVSDPENIVVVSEFELVGDAHQINISGDGNYAYVLMQRRFQVFDISDPENPEALGYAEATTGRLYDLDVDGDYAYILKEDGTLFIMDITNPDDPDVTSSYWSGFDFSEQVAAEGESCYLMGDGIVKVLDISEPHLPRERGSLGMQWCLHLAVSGDYAYISGGNLFDSSYVYVVNVKNSESPMVTGHYIYHRQMSIRDIVVTDYCYVLYNHSNASKIDVLDYSQALPVKEERQETSPVSYSLVSIYPNPFNATTIISYSLPSQLQGNIEIFNPNGQLVQNFAVPIQPTGVHQFLWDASQFSSGTYFLRLTAGNAVATRQAVLLK